ncbi:MAG TPA: PaaX family transcriptional regulator C-terminal domain-containing protein [Nocardioides sp.]|nr:PaaX family transcriptional regulator C-terminal domain-containing protein [Nocardioides sp.]
MSAMLALRPLSARSVVLSLLLGAHPAELSAAALVRAGDLFEVPETTLRATLSRMVTARDLVRDGGTYRLSERLLERQRRQDAALDAETTAWGGSWEQVVITSSGRSAQDRAELRATLSSLRLAELREGVWLRPANLARPLPSWPAGLISTFRATPDEDAVTLSHLLWDVDGWAAHGRALLAGLASADGARDQLTLSAAVVRHLLQDPALPEDLLPEAWPSIRLRQEYADYQARLIESTRGS